MKITISRLKIPSTSLHPQFIFPQLKICLRFQQILSKYLIFLRKFSFLYICDTGKSQDIERYAVNISVISNSKRCFFAHWYIRKQHLTLNENVSIKKYLFLNMKLKFQHYIFVFFFFKLLRIKWRCMDFRIIENLFCYI